MTADPRDDPLLVNAPLVDGYRVLDPVVLYAKIGEGGMGSVYRGKHCNLDIDVAVKVLDPTLARQDPEFVARFRREANLAAQVNHPNLVRVFDVRERAGLHYLVMEFVEGETALERVARKGRLGAVEAVDVILGSARGLGAAHASAVVHRDMKPENILVDRKGRVKVADLGLAKAAGSAGRMTRAKVQMGTPRYMPPEQWEDASGVGPPGDVWALGATFYFLLAGDHAIADGSLPQILKRVCVEPFPDIRKRRPEIPDALVRILERCTAKNPEERYPDGSALADELEGFRRRLVTPDLLPDEQAGQGSARTADVSPPPLRTIAKVGSGLKPKDVASEPRVRPHLAPRRSRALLFACIAGVLVLSLAGGGYWLVHARRVAALRRAAEGARAQAMSVCADVQRLASKHALPTPDDAKVRAGDAAARAERYAEAEALYKEAKGELEAARETTRAAVAGLRAKAEEARRACETARASAERIGRELEDRAVTAGRLEGELPRLEQAIARGLRGQHIARTAGLGERTASAAASFDAEAYREAEAQYRASADAWKAAEQGAEPWAALGLRALELARRGCAPPEGGEFYATLREQVTTLIAGIGEGTIEAVSAGLARLEEDAGEIARLVEQRAALSGQCAAMAEFESFPEVAGAFASARRAMQEADAALRQGNHALASARYDAAREAITSIAASASKAADELFARGRALLAGNPPDPAQALAAFERAERLFAQLGDSPGRSKCIHMQAWCLEPGNNPAGDWARAATLYEQAARLRGGSGDKKAQASSLYRNAWCVEAMSGWTKAAALYEQAARLYGETGGTGGQGWSLHRQAWCLMPGHIPNGDWAKVAALFELAARLQGEAGDKAGQGSSLYWRAHCLEPDKNPAGDWAAAAAVYAESARCYGEAGDKGEQASSIMSQASCLRPDKNAAGDWGSAAALYEQAARLRGEAGDKKGQGASLHQQAWCVEPDHNPAGDWAKAAALFGRAARLRGEAGDKAGQAVSLYQQGYCLQTDRNQAGDWAKAAAAYEQAARLYGEAGDKSGQGESLYQQGHCLQANHNPAGDWAKAAALFEQAARLYGEAGDKSGQGAGLHQQAYCIIRGDSANMTPEARALFERAAKLKRAAGDVKGAEISESWLK